MMRGCLRFGVWLGSVALLVFGSTPVAYAYIDPGSTNFIIQMIIGLFFGAGLAIATFWRRVKAFIGRLFGRPPATSDDQSVTERSSTEGR